MFSPNYAEIKYLRSTGQRPAALSLLKLHPPVSDEDAFEAVVCLFQLGDFQNMINICANRPWNSRWAARMGAALVEMVARENLQQALTCAREAVADPAAASDAQAFFLIILLANNLADEAHVYVRERLHPPPAGETFLLTAMAEAALAKNDFVQASQLASAAFSTDFANYRVLIIRSHADFGLANYHEALGSARSANRLDPGSVPATLQIMRCQNKLGDYYAVIAAFDALQSAAPVPPEVHVELGTAWAGLNHMTEAIAAYRAALSAGPPTLDAVRGLLKIHVNAGDGAAVDALSARHAALMDGDIDCVLLRGLHQLQCGQLSIARRHLMTCHDMNVRRGDALLQLPWPVPEPRLRHDYEQLELLNRRGKLGAGGKNALAVLTPYYLQSGDPTRIFAPEGAAGEALRKALCDIHYLPEQPFQAVALGANDYHAIEAQYAADKMVVIDNFLTPEALIELRRFCEEATIWKTYYRNGYTGALLTRGFSSEVILAIAEQLKRAMPSVIDNAPLLQAWGFKYDQRLQGINTHADFAKINVNFWVTPDASCVDSTSGGMVIYDRPVPNSWTAADYNSNPGKLRTFLRVHNAESRRVPFRENRCVLFDSSLIHVTDDLHFKPGYENRRINVTLLYGRARGSD
jgi:tetratricopeptide (TPR) repeat protein